MHISDEFDNILKYAGEEALRSGYRVVGPDHLMLGILRHSDNQACRALEASGLSPSKFKSEIDAAIFVNHAITGGGTPGMRITLGAQQVINRAMMEASLDGMSEVRAIHLLRAISQGPDCFSKSRLCGIMAARPASGARPLRTFIVRMNGIYS